MVLKHVNEMDGWKIELDQVFLTVYLFCTLQPTYAWQEHLLGGIHLESDLDLARCAALALAAMY